MSQMMESIQSDGRRGGAGGRPCVFAICLASVLARPFWARLWLPEIWQLVINTITTIVTFLMVFSHSKHPKP
jgi:low affinity Fe/Cu permease